MALSDDDLIRIGQDAQQKAHFEGKGQAHEQDRAAVAVMRALFDEAWKELADGSE